MNKVKLVKGFISKRVALPQHLSNFLSNSKNHLWTLTDGSTNDTQTINESDAKSSALKSKENIEKAQVELISGCLKLIKFMESSNSFSVKDLPPTLLSSFFKNTFVFSLAAQKTLPVFERVIFGPEEAYIHKSWDLTKVALVGSYKNWNDDVIKFCQKTAPTLQLCLEIKSNLFSKNIMSSLKYQSNCTKNDAENFKDSSILFNLGGGNRASNYPLTVSIGLAYGYANILKTRFNFEAVISNASSEEPSNIKVFSHQ